MILSSRNATQWDISVNASVVVPGLATGAGSGIGITFTDERGAVLMLPRGSSRVDSLNRATFRQYAMEHAVSWYQFVNECHGREAQNGAVYFITGFDKADCWENAVVNNTSRERSCELKFMPGIGVEGGLRLSQSSIMQSSVSSRCSSGDTTKNQSTFIRGFRVTLRHGIWGRLFGAPIVSSIYDSGRKDILGRKGGGPPFGPSSLSGGSSGPSFTSSGSSSLASHVRASPSLDVPSSSLRDARGDIHYDTYSKRARGGGNHSSEQDTFDDKDASDYDSHGSDTSVDEDDVLGTLQPYHPLLVINDHILLSVRHLYEVALT
ncbi:hypothetical protein V5O48_008857 [Marasmius crinis-equi]|uniref:Uncharacterized protein n=1 Tax=Marasmius crinis-equi TaxID=585013 RepID=A0ABR3FD30_9AGAR